MENRRRTLVDELAHRCGVGDVAGHHLEPVVRSQGRIRRRHVEQDEFVDGRVGAVGSDQRAARQQPLRELLADETGTAGDHDFHGMLPLALPLVIARPRR